MKWPHTAHAGVLAALRCACGYQAIARIGSVNAPPGDEGLDGITNVNNQAPHHGLARTKRPGLEEAALRFPQMQACSQKALLHKVPHVTAPAWTLGRLASNAGNTSRENVDREGPSHHVVAHGRHSTDGEKKRYREGAVFSGPIRSSSL